ncbi:hypothetical protein [uncultured Bacteroides sp.]|uniref:hypothetical protein n=1 Tax=uncultured Bacteroides sp. TaxID=162156 RepID=UPI0025D470D0|nr:hypothetical protein [uncultured Bacteroides sp.]
MKQMKFFLVALMAVVMGMSVTSCMNGEENNTVQGSLFVKVNAYDYPPSFVDASGIKWIPANTTVNANKSMALISFQYDRTTVEANATSVNVTLLQEPYYFDKNSVGLGETVVGNAPMLTLEPESYYGIIKGGFFDKNVLILPLAYWNKKYDNTTDKEKYEAEMNAHSFNMYCDVATDFKDGILTLTLVHNVSGGEEGVKRTDKAMDYKAFDISSVLSRISGTVNGVKVKVMENQSSESYKDASEKLYSIEYKFTE